MQHAVSAESVKHVAFKGTWHGYTSSAQLTCVTASFGLSRSDTPGTSAGALRLFFRCTVLCVLNGRETTIAFGASRDDCKRPLKNAAAKCRSVSRLMGRFSGNGSCLPSIVLNPTCGRRSRLPVWYFAERGRYSGHKKCEYGCQRATRPCTGPVPQPCTLSTLTEQTQSLHAVGERYSIGVEAGYAAFLRAS